MDKDSLERLLAKESDGELAPAEVEALEGAIASDAEAAKVAASWRRAGTALDGFVSGLGAPSPEVSERVLAEVRTVSSIRAAAFRDWRVALAAAAGVVLALGTGFGLGAAVFAERPPTSVLDTGTLRDALRETRALMPERVRWTALCGGRLSLGTSPVPVRGGGDFHFVTFTVSRSDRPTPMVSQIAVLDGEEALVEWESDGRWSISCLPVADGPDVALSTRVSFRPAGSERGVALASEPTVSVDGPVLLMSSRIGDVAFEVHVSVARAPRSGAGGRTTL